MAFHHHRRRIRKQPKKRGVRWLIVFVCIASLLAVNFILYNPFLGRLDLRERLGASRRSSVLLDRNGRVVTALNPARSSGCR